jgi:hypothetical protein
MDLDRDGMVKALPSFRDQATRSIGHSSILPATALRSTASTISFPSMPSSSMIAM